MKRICYPLITAILVSALIVLTSSCASPVKNATQLQSFSEAMQRSIQSRLSNLDVAVSIAAEKIALSAIQGEETRITLNDLYRQYPFLLDCSTADLRGRMVTVVPEAYRRYEGTDTASTEASKKSLAELIENRKPVLSNVFRAVEGVDAVVLVRPVITTNGTMLGMVCALFKPEDLLADIVVPVAEKVSLKVNVAQTDGLTIYCSNGLETGRNLLTDPRYTVFPELEAMGRRMVSQKTGSAEYTYTSDATGRPVVKTAHWTTIGLHGTEWRLVSIAELTN